MFERFTGTARRVVVIAQEQSREMRHPVIGNEHLLLGLIKAGGVADEVLDELKVSFGATKARILEQEPSQEVEPQGHVPFTNNAKKTLERALREALQLGHNYIGTEHILLALCRQTETLGCQTLESFVAPDAVVETVIEKIGGYSEASPSPESPPPPVRYDSTPLALKAVLDSLRTIIDLLELIDGRLYTLEQAANEEKS